MKTNRFMMWIVAGFAAMLTMAGTASAECYVNCGGGSDGEATNTSFLYGDKVLVNVKMWGNSVASGDEVVAGSYANFNWAATPVEVDGEMVSPASLSAGYQGYSEGTDIVDAGGALNAGVLTTETVWGKAAIDPSKGTEIYSGGGETRFDLSADGEVYGDEARLGAVGQVNKTFDLGDVDASIGGVFVLGQEGTGHLEGYGSTEGGLKFDYKYENLGWEKD